MNSSKPIGPFVKIPHLFWWATSLTGRPPPPLWATAFFLSGVPSSPLEPSEMAENGFSPPASKGDNRGNPDRWPWVPPTQAPTFRAALSFWPNASLPSPVFECRVPPSAPRRHESCSGFFRCVGGPEFAVRLTVPLERVFSHVASKCSAQLPPAILTGRLSRHALPKVNLPKGTDGATQSSPPPKQAGISTPPHFRNKDFSLLPTGSKVRGLPPDGPNSHPIFFIFPLAHHRLLRPAMFSVEFFS